MKSKLLCRLQVIIFEVRCFMTIDDELILLLLKPEKDGKVGEDALIIKVVGTRKFDYKLEESTRDLKYDLIGLGIQSELIPMTPDITVAVPPKYGKQIAIELENDIDWDFQKSLRKVKKYQVRFEDTRVIIPSDYEKFAPLYRNKGFRVYLWSAKRKWQCLRCETVTLKEGPIQPKCRNKKCGNKSRNEFRLVGVKDTKIEEYM